MAYLTTQKNVTVRYLHEVKKLRRSKNNWTLTIEDKSSDTKKQVSCDFVFIGAGGGALPLLEKSRIPEAKGYGGFPVSGQWLICRNQSVIGKHHVKAYGKAKVGTPPMSMPHLDTRYIKGEKQLLFGPYAGFTTRFLKTGSVFDLLKSIRFSNIVPMIAAAVRNLPLTNYLFNQVRLTPEARLDLLKEFVPNAKLEDWELAHAGMRVQIIKKDKEKGGVLEFGTELVSSADGSIAALLGASPGASVSVSIMLELLEKCFRNECANNNWTQTLKKIFPSTDAVSSIGERRRRTGVALNLDTLQTTTPAKE